MIRPYFKLPNRFTALPLTPWSLPSLCAAYGLPRSSTRIGTPKISIIELGGSWHTSDMQAFCTMTGMPVPTVVNPTSPFPSDPTGANYEIALDMQVAAFVAWWISGKVPILEMIWDQTGTIYEGLAHATGDTCSISWGAPENEWGSAAAATMSLAGWNAIGKGTTVCAATGDNAFDDGELGGAHVDLPAAAPSILGCSGTTKTATTETCWNNGQEDGTGGGISIFWQRPAWQTTQPVWGSGRAVGDVAAVADPNTGYIIVAGGQQVVIGGTSGVAPFMAGAIAGMKAKPGFVTAKFYQNPGAFTRITKGNNGKFPATICDGLGVINGAKFASLFTG